MKTLLTSFSKGNFFGEIIRKVCVNKVFILLGTFFIFSTTCTQAIDISKPSRICPGQAGTFTVTGLPGGTYRWDITITDVYDPNYLPQTTVVSRYIWESNSYTHTFNIVSGNATISVTAFTIASIQIGFESQLINKNLPAPAPPNNGTVIGCSPNQEIAISSLPALQNNATDCYFHCNYNWTAPSGFNLSHPGASGNPLLNAESIIFPSSPSNGNLGQLTISALYSSCSYTLNSSSSATIWYGPPIISYPNSWLFDAGSNMWQLSHAASPGSTSTYSVWSGSASLIPNGNDCYVTTTDGAVIELVCTNSCGNSTPYQFIIPPSSSYDGGLSQSGKRHSYSSI
ncbi:hypothetical protein [Runella slithyformis]|uniref:Uncharacterized protein n=1 Tax=Runella slithyformis (strain ATCC 29530 / DSM 19594 / LMG 11500 / NCIMB 11436 / LSU 4) TaxID=761193 RepID=A0A7U3ZKC8_RUNSL|nr:hypothetical protein [Runella slithyformis]AEI48757.1 hypothetical protein Runsl_2347 [Runella slithyformis DSM 19594]